jgi:hypothetical protein
MADQGTIVIGAAGSDLPVMLGVGTPVCTLVSGLNVAPEQPQAPAKETKTARRKREKAERLARAGAAERKRDAEARLRHEENRKALLRTRKCSEYWVEEAIARRPYHPNVPCRCEGCRPRRCASRRIGPCNCRDCRRWRLWPGPVVSARGISLDCHYAANVPDELPDGPPVFVSEAQAMDAGLSVRDPRNVWKLSRRFVAGCESCEGVRPGPSTGPEGVVAPRYCLRCEAAMRRDLSAAGWTPPMIEGWCRGEDWPLRGDVQIPYTLIEEGDGAPHPRDLRDV